MERWKLEPARKPLRGVRQVGGGWHQVDTMDRWWKTTYVGNVDFRGVLPPKEKRKTLEYSHLVVDVGGLQLFLGENLARELQFAPYHEGILDTTSYKSLPSKHYRYYS